MHEVVGRLRLGQMWIGGYTSEIMLVTVGTGVVLGW